MTEHDAHELVAVMMRWWPQAADRLATEGAAAGLVEVLGDVAPEHARAAVDAWSRDGQPWPPSPGQVRGKLADLALDAPDWLHVKAAVVGRAPIPDDAPELPDGCPHGLCDGSGLVVDEEANTASPCRCRPERQAIRRARRGQHPLVAEFIRQVGSVEVADLDGDRTAEAQVRRKWEEFLRGVRQQVTYAGMDTAGLPALERAVDPQRRIAGPRRMDPAGLLRGAA